MNPGDGICIYLSLWRYIPSYTADMLRYPQLFLYIYYKLRERGGREISLQNNTSLLHRSQYEPTGWNIDIPKPLETTDILIYP